jgi:hypothetical protein
VNVVARPLENDLFTWHGNIKMVSYTLTKEEKDKQMEKNPGEGATFHFEISIPQSYPH